MVKTPPADAGDKVLISDLEKIPWKRKWQLALVFLPRESCRAWLATVYGVAKSRTQLRD